MSNLFNFKKWNSEKIVLVILLIAMVFVVLPQTTYAQASGIIQGVLSGTIAFIAYVINLIIGFIAGILFEIGGSLVQFALDLNSNIIGQPVVIAGWQIILGFANLGFVLAIIVMAFATIFRVQSYAMKQTLWKLIVAALLVNFSLVIAGVFISVADTATNNFQQASQLTPLQAATTLANAFKIQDFLQVGSSEKTQICWWRGEGLNLLLTGPKVVGLCSPDQKGQSMWTISTLHQTCVCDDVTYQEKLNIMKAAFNNGDQLTGPMLTAVASILFAAAFTLIGALTLLALAIMLMIRFVALGFLLVLSPLALLFWIFPSTQHLWKKWWNNFFRWTFFAPAVSFFLFLAVKATQGVILTNPSSFDVNKAIENSLMQPGAVALILNMVIILGFLLGGLIVANSLSITFASTAYGWAQKGGKYIGKWMGRESLEQTGGRVFASKLFKGNPEKGRRGLTEYLSSRKFPGVRFIGRGINRLGLKTEETLQAGYAKLVKRMTPDQKNYEGLNSRGVRRAVILQQTAKDRDIDMKKLSPLIYNPAEMKDLERNFGVAGLDFKDFTRATGLTPETVQASADIEKADREKNPEALIKAEKNLKEATDRLVKSIPLKDYSKGQWNDFFEHSDNKIVKSIQKALSAGFAEHENGAYSKITPQIKGKNMDNYIKIINEGITEVGMNPKLAGVAVDAGDKFRKTLGRRAEFGEEPWTPGAGTTTNTTSATT